MSRRSIVYGITVGRSAFSYYRGQLEWFRQRGYDVTLVTSPDDAAKFTAEREGVSFAPIAMKREIAVFSDFGAMVRWIRQLRRLSPYAVNVSTPKAGLLGGLAAWLLKVPKRLYVVRGLRMEGSRGLKRCVLWAAEWVTQHLATDVIYVSQSLATQGTRLRLAPKGRSWVIGAGSSNGVFASKVLKRSNEVESTSLRNSLGIPQESFVIGFVGRVNRDKGIDTVVRAMGCKLLRNDVHLLAVGPIEDQALGQQLQSFSGRVSVVEWTDDVWGYLSVVDALILPTRREGFPNVVLEAAAARIPSITTCATGAVDSVIDGVTGYVVDIDDCNALVQRINRLAASPGLARRLGDAAAKRVRAEYRPENIWQGLADIVEGNLSSEYAIRTQHETSRSRGK